MWKFLLKLTNSFSNALLNLSVLALLAVGALYYYTSMSLPDVRQLRNTVLQIPLRVYSADGKLIGEFGEQRCLPVKLAQMPSTLINAFLDVEDQRFFEHKGVDFYSLVRAFKQLVATGRKQEGASTITMQVARNYFLNREKTFTRKINEILLAFNIDKYFSKREILELYLNKIYFGHRAYGVAAAAQVYYGKELHELTIAEQAMLAGLPQAPSRNNPISNPDAAVERRNHVLLRMYENDHLTRQQYQDALAETGHVVQPVSSLDASAHYVAEMVRQVLFRRYGERAYQDGYEVITTIDSKLQEQASQALCRGLVNYDSRHDYRGVEGNLSSFPRQEWAAKLTRFSRIGSLYIAVIVDNRNGRLTAMLADGQQILLKKPTHWSYFWVPGDLVRVYRSLEAQQTVWHLSQLPAIEGAILAIKPDNGAVLALEGGFDYEYSKFNRATSAERQLGSLFKPFLYSAALDHGYTLASIVNDTPLVIKLPGQPIWRPQNASGYFYGPTTLRTALVYSRNLVTIRLLQQLGITSVINHVSGFGFKGNRELPGTLSMALGAGTVTPLKVATAYAVFANGGYLVEPFFIERVLQYTTQGMKLVFRAPQTYLKSNRRVISEQNCYLINDVLHEVIERGTASRASSLNRKDIMGKTGSTNDLMDAWFVGYNQGLLGLVWVGFDQPRSTGEYGSVAALPIWIEFMKEALADQEDRPPVVPAGIVTAKVNKQTGRLVAYEGEDGYFEKFMEGQLPDSEREGWDEDDLWQNNYRSDEVKEYDNNEDELLF